MNCGDWTRHSSYLHRPPLSGRKMNNYSTQQSLPNVRHIKPMRLLYSTPMERWYMDCTWLLSPNLIIYKPKQLDEPISKLALTGNVCLIGFILAGSGVEPPNLLLMRQARCRFSIPLCIPLRCSGGIISLLTTYLWSLLIFIYH